MQARRNIPHYGFGIPGVHPSMIETAIEVTQGRVPADVISKYSRRAVIAGASGRLLPDVL